MEQALIVIKSNNEILTLISLFAAALSLLLLFINLFRTGRLMKRYKVMMRGAQGQDLEQVLNTYMSKVDASLAKTEEVRQAYTEIMTMAKNSIQNVGVVRYNAFDDTGSDLSFAVALLNHRGDGLVISSLFGRNETRTYAKPVTNGVSDYPLSGEEEQAIKKALNK
ncbi:DUF4446 family protein [Phosphitispora fastidiosa]|uniref:DUF4446 family protein n=1 Tax=Phosphitispora fastidiosa TaxID=2837202 RepID=UPI001E46A23C|nr:DUF4446 family protein [Phosphitispora fastidiosa]MBU7007541.1 hypothetical protein [Phosphitispora fastidiosa]